MPVFVRNGGVMTAHRSAILVFVAQGVLAGCSSTLDRTNGGGMDGGRAMDVSTADDGSVDEGAAPDLPPPLPRSTTTRLVAPYSGSIAGSRRPTFRWQQSASEVTQRLQVCPDRDCQRITYEAIATGGVHQVSQALPIGVNFWRVLESSDGPWRTSATWPVRIRAGSGTADTQYGAGRFLDFDGDGRADITSRSYSFPSWTPGPWCVWYSPVSPGTPPMTRWSPAPPLTRDAAPFRTYGFDLDADGIMDLSQVVSCFNPACGADRPAWFGAYPGSRERQARRTGTSAVVAGSRDMWLVGDLDRDGWLDRVIQSNELPGSQDTIAIHFGGPGPTRTQRLLSVDPRSATMVVGDGDLDGDGQGDLLIASHPDRFAPHSISLFLSSHSEPWGYAQRLDMPGGIFVAESLLINADLDWDGSSDGVVAYLDNTLTPRMVSFYYRVAWHGLEVRSTELSGLISRGSVLEPGDFDGDGRDELIAIASDRARMNVLLFDLRMERSRQVFTREISPTQYYRLELPRDTSGSGREEFLIDWLEGESGDGIAILSHVQMDRSSDANEVRQLGCQFTGS
ncbi:MAG: hypothetical protein HY909_29120 [Deltaproteobacteria bacterium]|nr:hypothetical protein [Deltaproteobacteria bacterium]